jgi:hypothetical protein
MKEEDNGVFFFSSKKKKKKNTEKKKCKEGKGLSFLFRFYIWDEALLLPSPLHIPSTLSSSCSLNIELSTFLKPCVLKLCAIQARELY